MPSNIPLLYRLPTELLSEILSLATASPEPVQTPTRLASITTRLRCIALQTPELWSSLYVSPFTSLELLELYISRSKGSLMYITANFSFSSDRALLDGSGAADDGLLSGPRILSLLKRAIPRAASLDIYITCSDVWLDGADGSTDLLSSLDCAAPKLRCLGLHLGMTNISRRFLASPMPELRSLTMTDVSHSQAAEFLERCPPLQDLTLEIDENHPYTLEQSKAMSRIFSAHSSSLVTLHVRIYQNVKHTYSISEGSILFPHLTRLVCLTPNAGLVHPITAPRLDFFSLECQGDNYILSDEDDPVANYNRLHGFFQRHLPILKSMTICVTGYPDFPWDAAPITRTSQVYTKLKTLSVTLDAAYVEETCLLRAPNLESLTFNFGDRFAPNWGSLISFIKYHSQTLRTLTIKCWT